MISESIFVKRQRILQEMLSLWKIDCLLCDHPTDIFYLTGARLSLGRLFVQAKSVVLFVDGRYYEAAKKKTCCSIRKMGEKEMFTLFASPKWKEVRVIGFDMSTPYIGIEKLKKQLRVLRKNLKRKLPYRLKGFIHPIQNLRVVKDSFEILLIKKSAALLWKGFLHAKRQLRIGVEEQQIALEFEFYCRRNGADELAFPPIIAFGPSSAFPHYHTGKRRLKKGDIVLMDLGVRLNGYASDMTRSFFFGQGSDILQKLYQVVAESKKAALSICQPGTTLAELDEVARKVMRKAKLEKHFLHSLGHGIGLDVHESPNFRGDKGQLQPGMVITIEPGLYLPGKGGVRLEDMVIITKTKHQNLFKL